MFDFMDEGIEAGKAEKDESSHLSEGDPNQDSLKQVALRLEKAADKIISERDLYKQEINQLYDRIKELEEQINDNQYLKRLETDIEKAKKLQMNLEKRISALIGKLKDLLEEENI